MKEIFIIKKGLVNNGVGYALSLEDMYVTEEIDWIISGVTGEQTHKLQVAKQFESYDEALKYLEKDEEVNRKELYQIQKWYVKEVEDEVQRNKDNGET